MSGPARQGPDAVPPTLPALLLGRLEEIRSFVQRQGRDLYDRESEEDLVQGIAAAALRSAGDFRHQGAARLAAWLRAVARRHLQDRRRYWFARKRLGGRQQRITTSDRSTGTPRAGVNPPAAAAGPSTVMAREEELEQVLGAIASLSRRDQEVLRCLKDGLGTMEIAGRLGISAAAAERARSRALERLRRALASPASGRPAR